MNSKGVCTHICKHTLTLNIHQAHAKGFFSFRLIKYLSHLRLWLHVGEGAFLYSDAKGRIKSLSLLLSNECAFDKSSTRSGLSAMGTRALTKHMAPLPIDPRFPSQPLRHWQCSDRYFKHWLKHSAVSYS